MLTADGAELVEAYSENVSHLVRRSMLGAIPDGEPHRWLYRVARVYPSRPGKALWPALSVATCRAFGGSDGQVLPVAVAIELLHNAFLVANRRGGARLCVLQMRPPSAWLTARRLSRASPMLVCRRWAG